MVGPAERKPKAVVETTRAERRALDSSERVWRCVGGVGVLFAVVSHCVVSVDVGASADVLSILCCCTVALSSDVLVEKD